MKQVRFSIGSRWPMLSYLSLAFYSAWILLTVTSNEAVSLLNAQLAGTLQWMLYLSSGAALSACLILSGVFSKRLQPIIEHGPFVIIMGALASVCTIVLVGGLGIHASGGLFVACGIGTGIGTSFVCLRAGYVTSRLNGVDAAMTVSLSALVANLIFFSCQALPPIASHWAISVLPLLSALASFCSPSDDECGPEQDDIIDVRFLPKGYFVRLICTVFVFALAAGVAKGITAFTMPNGDVFGAKQSTWEVLFSFLAVLLFMVGVTVVMAFKNFDLSKLYLPVGFATAAGMLLCPIFGSFLQIQGILENVLYNVFILVVWCWLIELAGRTSLGPVRVFGFGRGASALATTLGWAIVVFAQQNLEDPSTAYMIFFLVLAFSLLAMMMLVLNERTVSEALAKTMARQTGVSMDGQGSNNQDDIAYEDPWSHACGQIAADSGLTAREAEVFALLSRGRSISYIADELVIAPNTVKGYTKNVYAKVGIHSRQELIDLTESVVTAGH